MYAKIDQHTISIRAWIFDVRYVLALSRRETADRAPGIHCREVQCGRSGLICNSGPATDDGNILNIQGHETTALPCQVAI